MTVLLWILLILSAAALIIISSPIRFGAAGTFGKSKRAGGKFWLSYMHPALFIYEYSSTGHKERVAIFGINPRWFRRKKRKRQDTDGANNIDNFNSINDININDDINDNDDGDTLMTRMARLIEHIKDDPIYTKTVDKLNAIKSEWFHSYLKDKVFRRKLFRWLKRAWKRAFTTVRFDKLKLRAAAGFNDPAQTGEVYGYFTAAKNALAPRNRTVSVEFEPVFTEKRLDADIEFAGRTSAAIIISNVLTAALTFPYLRMKRLTKSKTNS